MFSGRRRFLSSTLASTLGLAGLAATGRPRPASATEATHAVGTEKAWGDYPPESLAAQLPEQHRAKQVLELFLWGGISPWETFYAVDEDDFGRKRGEMWWTYLDGPNSVPEVFERCHGPGLPLLQPFARDANGVMVKLGPFTEPLRSRQDIVDRLRIHVVGHDLVPHDVAVPLAVTGYRLGSPKIAGVGAAVQHYFQSRQPSAEPYAYLVVPFGRKADSFFIHAAQVGQHPAFSLPLTLHVHGKRDLLRLLRRNGVGGRRETADRLLRHLADSYGDLLRPTAGGPTTRSPGFDAYDFSREVVGRSDQLLALFDGTEAIAPSTVELAGLTGEGVETSAQLEMAVHLLKRPGSKAKQVTVIDRGFLLREHDFAYDTHYFHVKESGPMLAYVLRRLTALINKPGERDPRKIDLDDTLVVVNTEFGRTPWKEHAEGRNHYPNAYTTLMFGGPIGAAQRGIVGAIDEEGRGQHTLTPASTRAALLAALGIYPLAPECYAISDFPDLKNRADVAHWITRTVLGHGA